MTEKQSINTLNALGCKDVTTNRQKSNGTTMFELPTGDIVAEFNSGYIRKYLMSGQDNLKFHTCYQLNPTYNTNYKSVNSHGELIQSESKARMLIHSRSERLKRLVSYTVRQINKSNG